MQHWDLLRIDAPNGTRDPAVLHSDAGGRAVLVALNPGQALGDHQVKEIAWVAVVEGRAVVTTAGDELEAGPGSLFRFDPAERHSVRTETGARILLVLAPWPGEGHYAPSEGDGSS
jgi:quercetin dioxygenase-like cupin family protein